MQNKKLIQKPFVVCILAMVCCALWGSAFPFIKIGYSLLGIQSDDWSGQILFAGIRFFTAGVLVILFGSLISNKILLPNKHSAGKICILSLFQTILQYLFFYIGLAHISGTKGSIINATNVFFAVIISCLILKQEKFTLQKMIGCIVGFAGVVIINLTDGSFDSGFTFTGEGFIVLSALSYAFSSALIKKFSQTENPVTLSGYQFVLGGLVMSVFGFAAGGRITSFDAKAFGLMMYLALLSAVAYTLWGILLKYNNVSMVAVYGFMTQIFGCFFSVLFLGERLSQSGGMTLTALILVSVGIIIVNMNLKVSGEKNESKDDTCQGI